MEWINHKTLRGSAGYAVPNFLANFRWFLSTTWLFYKYKTNWENCPRVDCRNKILRQLYLRTHTCIFFHVDYTII